MAETLPAIMSDIPPPAMPTCELYAPLLRVRSWRDDGRIEWDVYVNPKNHIDRDDCKKILTELERANLPATMAVATRITKLMIGAYRKADLADPATFVRIIAATFSEYPAEVALKAADDLTRTLRWIPSRAEVIEACNRLMLERKYAAYVARKHLERHDELDRERENELKRMEERRQRYVREPWLMIADTYRKAFCCAGNDDWLAWLKSACNEFGVRAVEAWHDEALDAAAKPDSWYFLREFLNKCATKAREEEQP